jgi:hypothetical protein
MHVKRTQTCFSGGTSNANRCDVLSKEREQKMMQRHVVVLYLVPLWGGKGQRPYFLKITCSGWSLFGQPVAFSARRDGSLGNRPFETINRRALLVSYLGTTPPKVQAAPGLEVTSGSCCRAKPPNSPQYAAICKADFDTGSHDSWQSRAARYVHVRSPLVHSITNL